MTGPEHYERAEFLMFGEDAHPDLVREALVHATLALAAATAEGRGLHWDEVLT